VLRNTCLCSSPYGSIAYVQLRLAKPDARCPLGSAWLSGPYDSRAESSSSPSDTGGSRNAIPRAPAGGGSAHSYMSLVYINTHAGTSGACLVVLAIIISAETTCLV
jgi:hypothetical protein